jgi:hypothetical protein
MVMAAKLTRLTHKIAIQLHLEQRAVVPFAVLAPGGQSRNFWIHSRTTALRKAQGAFVNLLMAYCILIPFVTDALFNHTVLMRQQQVLNFKVFLIHTQKN